MDRSLIRRTFFGLLLTIPVFGLLFWFVDIKLVFDALQQAKQTILGLTVVAVLGWLFAWSLSLRTVLRVKEVYGWKHETALIEYLDQNPSVRQ